MSKYSVPNYLQHFSSKTYYYGQKASIIIHKMLNNPGYWLKEASRKTATNNELSLFLTSLYVKPMPFNIL